MDEEQFVQNVACGADVILDGQEWSGNNSSLEALAFAAPIVTLPGRFFRSRHTYGIFQQMGLSATVAQDVDDYVAIAVRLGVDHAFRSEVRHQIARTRSVLYEDVSVPHALGDHLERLIINPD